MENASRYAVYYAPEVGSDLAGFGASWLGWDAETGRTVPHPDGADLPLAISELTETPRKYGLHGTLKPPFKLSKGYTVTDLDTAISELASQQPAFEIPHISLHAISTFLVITPTENSDKLARLAENCVRNLDAFRASPSEGELSRRRTANLSDAQEHNLMRWGYPYVLNEFRFHLTLTGRLASEHVKPVAAHLQGVLAQTLAAPLPVREICLFGQDIDARFHIIKRYPLTA